jgi:hypothetical protein
MLFGLSAERDAFAEQAANCRSAIDEYEDLAETQRTFRLYAPLTDRNEIKVLRLILSLLSDGPPATSTPGPAPAGVAEWSGVAEWYDARMRELATARHDMSGMRFARASCETARQATIQFCDAHATFLHDVADAIAKWRNSDNTQKATRLSQIDTDSVALEDASTVFLSSIGLISRDMDEQKARIDKALLAMKALNRRMSRRRLLFLLVFLFLTFVLGYMLAKHLGQLRRERAATTAPKDADSQPEARP